MTAPAQASGTVAGPVEVALEAPVDVEVTEVRVLEGPNLFFARPAVKVSARLPGYLGAPEEQLRALAERLGLRGVRPGPAGSEQRQRFAMRLAAYVVRRIAHGAGTRRLSVRVRAGSEQDAIVVAYPWRRRGRATALADGLGTVLAALLGQDPDAAATALSAAVDAVASAPDGPPATMLRPAIPVASVTGTNGKTTTTRLLAHIGMTAGLCTAWSSTDGVLVGGELVEPGDYSGPAGARMCLQAPGVQLAVLETARGGMLLKGVGVAANDVSVVTNVSADHLGQQGIDTVDQLAEVKAIITRITRPGGWVVLNGDDPRVWAMRTRIRARPFAFSLDPDSPALAEALLAGGRGITVLGGDIVVLRPHADPDELVTVLDVPMTLSGLSAHNLANALAAAAAALGLGLPREAVVAGLRSFAPDAEHNPGRMNVYTVPLRGYSGRSVGEATVILDLAHNEAGLEALLRVARGLRPPGSLVHLGLGTAGDRTDEILQALGELGGRWADRVAAVHKTRYLRGRTAQGLEAQLRLGLARAGIGDVDSYDSELDGLKGLLAGASNGDVVAVMCHADWADLHGWLLAADAVPDGPERIRDKVVAARGEHPAEAELARLAAEPDPSARVAGLERLLRERPGDPRLGYELAVAQHAAGRPYEAATLLTQAVDGGLREPYRLRAQLRMALLSREGGDSAAARDVAERLARERPDSAAVTALRAVLQAESGDVGSGVTALVDALLARSTDVTDEAYAPALHDLASSLRGRDGEAGQR